MILQLHSDVGASLMSLHDIRWCNEVLTGLLIDLRETRDIRITVDLSDTTGLSTVSCRCLLGIFLGNLGGLLNFILWPLANNI